MHGSMNQLLKKVMIAVVGLVIFKPSNAQEKTLKAFSNFLYTHNESSTGLSESSESSLSFSPGLSLSISHKQKNFHEIGIMNISYDRNKEKTGDDTQITSGAIEKDLLIRFRYDYNFSLSRSPGSKWKVFLGPSFSPYYARNVFEPFISTQFYKVNWAIGSHIALLARSIVELSPKILLDINVPVNLATLEFQYTRESNPNLPVSRQRLNELSLEGLPSYFEFRVGLGVRI